MLLAFPIILPLTAAILSLFLWQQRYAQRALTLASALITLILALVMINTVQESGIQHLALGGWQPPFGIVLVADLFSAIMVTLSSLIGLAVTTFSLFNLDRQRVSFGYYPLVNTLLMGINGAFLTGDLFNLYVWFEVLLISSFVLLGLGSTRQQLEGTIKYVVINLVASTVFLTALALLYGWTGTLNMADLSRKVAVIATTNPGMVSTLSMLFLIAFGVKAALVPFHFWLPSSYHTPPASVSAVFAGLLTKVGIYSLTRMFTLVFIHDARFTHNLILGIAGVTMIIGVLGAASQIDMRRILAFHSVSQVGYMAMGLGLFTVTGLAGTLYFMIHHAIVKSNLFLVTGTVRWRYGTSNIKRLGGLINNHLGLASLFAISALALAGIPPLSGFWPKLLLVRGGLEIGQGGIVAASLVTSLITTFSMVKIWLAVFWGKRDDVQPLVPNDEIAAGQQWGHLGPIIANVVLIVLLGVFAEPIYNLVSDAALQLKDPQLYITSVLGN